MRRLILFAALAATAFPALAAKKLTVAQLEQVLVSDFTAHRADADVARRIGDFDLTERLTPATLDRFAARMPLGPRTALALQLLADQSAFLDPPAAELPATEPPDAAAQQRMMDQARGYVVKNWPRLPNFFLTRTTHSFDDGKQVLKPGDWPVRAGLHLARTSSRQITFRDGKEVQDSPLIAVASTAASPVAQQEAGLHTWGEFGPELAIVLTDTAKGQVAWSHWESTPAGLAAVFRYAVPRTASHYAVNYCCVRSSEFIERRDPSFRSRGSQDVTNVPQTVAAQPFQATPGYHGSLFVDPATGAILRVTLKAELKESDPITRAETVVDYGRVRIGDQMFICPISSLAISMEPTTYEANGEPRDPSTLLINETSFTDYHRLGTSIRVLADNSASDAAASPAASAAAPPPDAARSSPPTSTRAGTQPAASQPAPDAEPTAPSTSELASGPPPPPAPPANPEFALSAASDVPNQPAAAPEPRGSAVTLKVTSRLVDVGVIVYDKKGHPVKDLKPDDFEVFDNGRKQEIRFFSQFSSDTQPPVAAAAAPAGSPTYSNRAEDPADAGPSHADAVTSVLLIDESHIAWADLSNARQQAINFLSATQPGERIGLYSMTERGFKVLKEVTSDHGALIARLKSWMPSAQSISFAQEEESRNRQQINEVHNVADLNSVNGNRTEVPDADQPVDPQLLTMGDNPGRAALIILTAVARHLAALPGHKSLIWFSSDNVFADWRDQAVGIDKSPKPLDRFALSAQEAMNDAHAAVYPFDVSQLEAGGVSADIQHRNVELTQAAQDAAALAAAGAAAGGKTASSPAGDTGRDLIPGRVSAQMSQDLHPFQGPIREVAQATGGRTIRRSGDMAAQLASIVTEGHTSYLMSFHPDTNADNQYHILTVKLVGKHGLTARYRSGYFYARDPSTLHDRFQQAVWRPVDANEVAITADVDRTSDGAEVRINVATGDLGMQEQAGRWIDRLDIFFVQRDDSGTRAQVEGQALGLRLKPETYQSLLPAGIPYEHVVRLKPGTASVRVVVVDENSGRMGSVTIPAEDLGGGQ